MTTATPRDEETPAQPTISGEDRIWRLPNSDNHNCFACGANNHAGLRMQFFTDGQALFSEVLVDEHLCGWGKVIHGGILTTILDEIMAWTGIYMLERVAVTQTISVDFQQPAFVGDQLAAVGRVTRSDGGRKAEIQAEITRPDAKVCARARGTFALLSPKLALRMALVTPEVVRDFFDPLMAFKKASGHAH